ncbi:hypothetical protein T10_11331 [Trichinella papuae]|uniref:Uncharacterized protein n=1 Tax=Trichinella papuae TaxID=268474 RepID=A0A0V1N687_9BILA|nr:hypothetical protein T10_11331 [Trichinella papuae]
MSFCYLGMKANKFEECHPLGYSVYQCVEQQSRRTFRCSAQYHLQLQDEKLRVTYHANSSPAPSKVNQAEDLKYFHFARKGNTLIPFSGKVKVSIRPHKISQGKIFYVIVNISNNFIKNRVLEVMLQAKSQAILQGVLPVVPKATPLAQISKFFKNRVPEAMLQANFQAILQGVPLVVPKATPLAKGSKFSKFYRFLKNFAPGYAPGYASGNFKKIIALRLCFWQFLKKH